MRFGIWIPRGGRLDEDEDSVEDAYQFAIDVARQAESKGFTITLVAQRYMGRDLDAWVLSSALAASTSTLELMVAIHPGIVSPQVVAKMGATLDVISGGRFAVNIVNGWWEEEMNLFGNGAWLERSEQRYRRMDEFIQVIKGMWTKPIFSFQGEFYNFDSARLPLKPVRKPYPPIYATSHSDAGKEFIARQCEYWFASYQAGYRLYEENVERIAADLSDMDERSRRSGRKLGYGLSANVICADTQKQAEKKANEMEEAGTIQRRLASSVIGLGAGLVGTPDLIAERVRRYEQIGIDCLLLRFPSMLTGIEVFAKDVMPLLEGQLPRSVLREDRRNDRPPIM
jgi:FMNH2-dependent dimethyl sulfone monooxygenase